MQRLCIRIDQLYLFLPGSYRLQTATIQKQHNDVMSLALVYGKTATAEETGKCNLSAIIFGSVLLGPQDLYLYYYTIIPYCFR